MLRHWRGLYEQRKTVRLPTKRCGVSSGQNDPWTDVTISSITSPQTYGFLATQVWIFRTTTCGGVVEREVSQHFHNIIKTMASAITSLISKIYKDHLILKCQRFKFRIETTIDNQGSLSVCVKKSQDYRHQFVLKVFLSWNYASLTRSVQMSSKNWETICNEKQYLRFAKNKNVVHGIYYFKII